MDHAKLFTFAGCAVALVLLAVLAWSRRWMSDDGFIYLRVVQNLRAGHGPVFNAGERVEADTGPAWVAVLALADLLSPFRLEWTTVVVGILATLLGAATAAAAASTLQRRALQQTGVLVPAGLAVFIAIPAVWDYASSGLETGLFFGWLGVAAWLVVRWATQAPRPRVPWWLALVAGLGPLIRPDAALFSLAFVLPLLLYNVDEKPGRDRLRIALWALSLPGLFELFRAGYYGALAPNTAFAKESSIAKWAQGYRYLTDFVTSYRLWFPAIVIALLLIVVIRKLHRANERPTEALVWGLIAAGLLDALYTVFEGGSHMDARLFLPSLLALIIPIAVVSLDKIAVPATVALVVWAGLCAVTFRPPPNSLAQFDRGVIDLRAFFVAAKHNQHPVTIDTHILPIRARDRSIVDTPSGRVANPPGDVGAVAYYAGPDVYVLDRLGLADWLSGRLPLTTPFPDHQKALGPWSAARIALETGLPPKDPDADTVAGTQALNCGDLAELRRTASARLTPARFLGNIVDAFRLYDFRVPESPQVAEREFC